jgi:hypothetical protein
VGDDREALAPGDEFEHESVDRLLHRAHLVLTGGDSHGLAKALAGKGMVPLR